MSESQPQKQQMEHREKLLDEYERNLGLPNILTPGKSDELQEYLVMNRSQIEAMTTDEAIAISLRLAQFSFYVQRSLNRERSIVKWAEQQIESIVAKELIQYSDLIMKHEAKAALVCRENVAARELVSIKTYATQRSERLNELAGSLRNLSYVFGLVCKNKQGDRK